MYCLFVLFFFFFQAEDGIRDHCVTGVQTCALPILVGNVTYTDDFGDPRPGGWHEGNDLMSVRHQPAIAFVAGRVQTYVPSPGSSTGTCMLYLHAKNGMTYVYIHLNNDLGPNNDNKGHCEGGVSWPSGINGDHVRRGQLVGFVGDSGDANGIQPHLHFEVRKPSGRAINPFSHLKKSKHLLFPRTPADSKVTLKGTKVLDRTADSITVRTKRIVVPSLDLDYLYARRVTLSASDATVRRKSGSGSLSAPTRSPSRACSCWASPEATREARALPARGRPPRGWRARRRSESRLPRRPQR